MATLGNRRTGRKHVLETECLVGRHESCNLRLDEPFVSARHATFRWSGRDWEIKDLDSNNGTFVNGTRLPHPRPIAAGTVIAFGRLENEWELLSDASPAVTLTSLDGNDSVVADDDIFALPSPENAQATVMPIGGGLWKLERIDGDAQVLENGSIFEVGGRRWRLICPAPFAPTDRVEKECKMNRVSLTFLHDAAQEYVKVSASYDTKRQELGSHACYYLLLFLARARQTDAANGESQTSAGWRYIDQLSIDLAMVENRINVEVYRNRQLAARAGVPDAISIIERRPRTGQLRIGTGLLTIDQV